MADAVDPIFFQEKGVFFTNVMELVRAHQNAANRVIAAEKKLADTQTGDGSDFASLDKKVTDFGGSLDTLRTELDSVHAKLDKLFPDESATPAPTEDPKPAEPAPVEDPIPADPEAPEAPKEEPAPTPEP